MTNDTAAPLSVAPPRKADYVYHMHTLLTALLLFTLGGLYLSVWQWIRGKQLDKRVERTLWLTLHRVAYRHRINIPDGLLVDEAGIYVTIRGRPQEACFTRGREQQMLGSG